MNQPSDSAVLREIASSVGEIKGTLSEFVPATKSRLDDYSRRIRFIERWSWIATGGFVVIVWLIGHHLLTGGK